MLYVKKMALLYVKSKFQNSSFSTKMINATKYLVKNRSKYIFTNRQVLVIILNGKLTAARQTDYLVKYQPYDIVLT